MTGSGEIRLNDPLPLEGKARRGRKGWRGRRGRGCRARHRLLSNEIDGRRRRRRRRQFPNLDKINVKPKIKLKRDRSIQT